MNLIKYGELDKIRYIKYEEITDPINYFDPKELLKND